MRIGYSSASGIAPDMLKHMDVLKGRCKCRFIAGAFPNRFDFDMRMGKVVPKSHGNAKRKAAGDDTPPKTPRTPNVSDDAATKDGERRFEAVWCKLVDSFRTLTGSDVPEHLLLRPSSDERIVVQKAFVQASLREALLAMVAEVRSVINGEGEGGVIVGTLQPWEIEAASTRIDKGDWLDTFLCECMSTTQTIHVMYMNLKAPGVVTVHDAVIEKGSKDLNLLYQAFSAERGLLQQEKDDEGDDLEGDGYTEDPEEDTAPEGFGSSVVVVRPVGPSISCKAQVDLAWELVEPLSALKDLHGITDEFINAFERLVSGPTQPLLEVARAAVSDLIRIPDEVRNEVNRVTDYIIDAVVQSVPGLE